MMIFIPVAMDHHVARDGSTAFVGSSLSKSYLMNI